MLTKNQKLLLVLRWANGCIDGLFSRAQKADIIDEEDYAYYGDCQQMIEDIINDLLKEKEVENG